MAEQEQTNGAAEPQPKGLREIAEAAYDEVLDASEESDAGDYEESDSGQPRDERGRWVPKSAQPGEAAAPEAPPSPQEPSQETEEHPAPAEQPGVAAQAPSNWSAEDRANFEKLPPEGQQFLLRRHSEMEGDYQKRVQATAFSNQFVTAITPVFNDPDIAESLRQQGRSPIEMVYQWGGFHKRALSQNPQERVQLLFELADRMQLDPAVVFGRPQQTSPMAFSKEELANPAIKKFADHIGHLTSQLQAQQSNLQRIQQQEQAALVGQKRAEIDAFAAAKNADGSLAHPEFDAFLPVVMEVYKANPTFTVEQAYDAAVKPVRDRMEAQLKAKYEQQQNVQRAQTAVRGNVRGITAPVSKPPTPQGKRGLRQVMEEAAEEIGFNG